MNRLTDNRLGNGWYQPKNKEERKQLQNLGDVSYKELYQRLNEYENLGLSPEEIKTFIDDTRKDVDTLMSYQTFNAMLKERGLINEEQDVARVISSLEKQIPKKPLGKFSTHAIYDSDGNYFGQLDNTAFKCPTCNNILATGEIDATDCVEIHYCDNCGQALDWSDAE